MWRLLFLLAILAAWLLPPVSRSPWIHGHAPPGATVRVKNTPHVTLADPWGRFTLPAGGRLTASLPDHFIAGAPARDGVRFQLTALPREDHAGYRWAAPSDCADCHQQSHDQWAAGPHAGSAINPGFRRHYERLLRDKPDASSVCTSCHAPGLAHEDPAFEDLRLARGALSGVHCDYCHKVNGLNDGEIGLTHGRFLLKLLRPREGQVLLGGRDDADRGENAFHPLYRDSRYCAACHEGNVFGVDAYTTYSEWRESPAGRAGVQCQECHMKREPMAGHDFDAGRGVRVEAQLKYEKTGVWATVRVQTTNVGHLVPTGFLEKRLVLELESGPWREEVTFGREMKGPFWQGEPGTDTRLRPGGVWTKRVPVPSGVLRARLKKYRYQTQPDEGKVVGKWVWGEPREGKRGDS